MPIERARTRRHIITAIVQQASEDQLFELRFDHDPLMAEMARLEWVKRYR